MTFERLERTFNPDSIAVVGASENRKKVGYLVMKSLRDGGFGGKIYPVNPKYDVLMGFNAYPSVVDVPAGIDLAIVAVPPSNVPPIMDECVEKGIPGAVIITAGFKESEMEEGTEIQNQIAKTASKGNIKVIGPNTFGVVNLGSNLNASFTSEFSLIERGKISLVSQSGGVCHMVMPYALREGLGFNKIMSLGNRLTVGFHNMIDYLVEDEGTESIALYIEGLDKPRKLMRAAKTGVSKKPIVAYKAGRAEVSDQASLSHTGSLAGRYDLYEAAFRQAGIIPAHSIEELICKADALARQPPSRGREVGVVTLVAGPGMITSDHCESTGMKLANFSGETERKLKDLLPPLTIRTNPVDLGLTAGDLEKCESVIKTVFYEESVNCVIVNYLYSWSQEYLKFPARAIIEASKETGKSTTVCLEYPGNMWDEYKSELKQNDIPVFPSVELAAKAMAGLVERGQILRKLD